MIHHLKIDPEHFEAHLAGRKSFELRIDDREFPYAEGDTLHLIEFDRFRRCFTGRNLTRVVVSVLREHEGLARRYCVMSLRELEP